MIDMINLLREGIRELRKNKRGQSFSLVLFLAF